MWQHTQGLAVSVVPEPIDVSRERLAYSLIIVEKPDLAPNKLAYPDCSSISLCASAANIPNGPDGHQRVFGQIANAAF